MVSLLERIDLQGFGWATYRPGLSLRPFTPLQQLRHLAAGQLGHRVEAHQLSLSPLDFADLLRRTAAFADAFLAGSPGTAALLKHGLHKCGPTVNPNLPRGQAEYLADEQ